MTSRLGQSRVPTLKRGLGTALCLSTVSRRAHPLGWVRIATLAALLTGVAACGGAAGSHAGAVEPAVRDTAAVHTVGPLRAAIAPVGEDSAAGQQVVHSPHKNPPRAASPRAP